MDGVMAVPLRPEPGERVEYRPNVFSGERRYRGDVVGVEGDCVWVRVLYSSGRERIKTAHRQWLTIVQPENN